MKENWVTLECMALIQLLKWAVCILHVSMMAYFRSMLTSLHCLDVVNKYCINWRIRCSWGLHFLMCGSNEFLLVPFFCFVFSFRSRNDMVMLHSLFSWCWACDVKGELEKVLSWLELHTLFLFTSVYCVLDILSLFYCLPIW